MNKFLMMKTEMESNGNSLIKAVPLLGVRKILFLLFVFIGSFMGAYAQSGVTPYIGEIRCVPYNFAPTGWAECNGQLLPISQYTALFALLGTTYGGNGTTSFALPDLRGRVPIGVSNVKDLPEVKLGQVGGSATVTLTTEQLPAHTHDTQVSTSKATTNKPGTLGQAADLGPKPVKVYVETQQNLSPSTPTTTTGSNQPHNNMMPYLGLKWIIALQGVYPSRP